MWVGARLALSTTAFIVLNMALIGLWMLVVGALSHAHARKEAAVARPVAPEAPREVPPFGAVVAT